MIVRDLIIERWGRRVGTVVTYFMVDEGLEKAGVVLAW